MNPIILVALIAALKQEVVLLEQELTVQQSVQQVYIPPVAFQNPTPVAPIENSTTLVSPTLGDVQTSTPAMCEYIVPGRGGMQLSCAEIQACSLAHNCPIVPEQ